MDLTQRQVGVMLLDLLGIPAVSDEVERDRANHDPRALNDRFTFGVVLDVSVGHRGHDDPSLQPG